MKRDRSEWMPFYCDRFDEDEAVAELSGEAEALYQRMLRRQWKFGSLPTSEKALAALFPKFAPRMAELLAELRGFFEERDGRLVNPTCDEVRRDQEAKAERSRGGAAKTNAKRWSDSTDNRSAIGERSPSDEAATRERSLSESENQREKKNPQVPSEPSPPPGGQDSKPPAVTKRARTKPADPEPLLALPENADLAPCAESIRAWAAHKRGKFTPIVADNTLARARELGPERLAAAVRFSIASSYQGLIEPPQAYRNGRHADPPKTADQLAQEAKDFERAKLMFGEEGAA